MRRVGRSQRGAGERRRLHFERCVCACVCVCAWWGARADAAPGAIARRRRAFRRWRRRPARMVFVLRRPFSVRSLGPHCEAKCEGGGWMREDRFSHCRPRIAVSRVARAALATRKMRPQRAPACLPGKKRSRGAGSVCRVQANGRLMVYVVPSLLRLVTVYIYLFTDRPLRGRTARRSRAAGSLGGPCSHTCGGGRGWLFGSDPLW